MLQCLAAMEALLVSHVTTRDPGTTFAVTYLPLLALPLGNKHLHPSHLVLLSA